MKHKKETISTKERDIPAVVTGPAGVATYDLLDQLIGRIRKFGFRQIAPPPITDKADLGQTSSLPSSQLLNIGRLYEAYHAETSGAVAKWFYTYPVTGEENKEVVTQHELGLFILGDRSPLAYAQLINAAIKLTQSLGISELVTEINSVGCEACQDGYQKQLQDYLTATKASLCAKCHRRLEEEQLFALVCDRDDCQAVFTEAPQLIDCLDESCREQLVGILEILDELELSYSLASDLTGEELAQRVAFQLKIARSGKTFELIGQGGDYARYVRAVQEEEVPILGFLTTIERLAQFVDQPELTYEEGVDVFLVCLGDMATRRALRLCEELRLANIRVGEAMLGNRGIKSQLQQAQLYRPELALIIGQKEAMDETVILRDMRSGMQEVFTAERIMDEVKKRLER